MEEGIQQAGYSSDDMAVFQVAHSSNTLVT